MVQALSPIWPLVCGVKIPFPNGYQMSRHNIAQLAIRFPLTVKRPIVIRHLFTLIMECPAIETLPRRESPYYLARSPDNQSSGDRVAHTINVIIGKPTDSSIRRYATFADARLAALGLRPPHGGENEEKKREPGKKASWPHSLPPRVLIIPPNQPVFGD